MVPETFADDATHRSRSDSIAQARLRIGEAILEHWNAALGLAHGILRDRDKADDVLQEAACRALAYAHTFDWSRPIAPWFFRIVRNAALTSVRREKPTCELTEVPGRHCVEDNILQAEERGALQSAFERLPRRYRQVLHLRYNRDYEYKRISRTLDIPLGTTKILLHRARREIRARYLFEAATTRSA